MTLQELKYIVVLADTGHFGQAATACFVTQSTLSTQIKKLEAHLGVILFDRSVRRATPTPVGREIIESARLILQETTRIQDLSRYAQDPMKRSVHLGVIPTLGPYYLPHALTTVRRTYPDLRLLLREELTGHLLAHLADGKLDGALLALPISDPAFEIAPLFQEPFLAAMPRDHALACQNEVGLSDLARNKLLLLEEGHCLRAHALQVCGLEELKGEDIRATSLETLRQMVGMGLGVTLMPLLAGSGTHAASTLVILKPLAAAGASRTIALAWRQRSPAAQTMGYLAKTLGSDLPEGVTPLP